MKPAANDSAAIPPLPNPTALTAAGTAKGADIRHTPATPATQRAVLFHFFVDFGFVPITMWMFPVVGGTVKTSLIVHAKLSIFFPLIYSFLSVSLTASALGCSRFSLSLTWWLTFHGTSSSLPR